MQDRYEDALDALTRLRGKGNEMSAEAELELMRDSLREESQTSTYAELLKGHNRRRTLVVIGVAFFFQATGQVFSGHYGAIFIKSLGTINPWTIQLSQSSINTVTSFVGIIVSDRWGRRYVRNFPSFCQIVSLTDSPQTVVASRLVHYRRGAHDYGRYRHSQPHHVLFEFRYYCYVRRPMSRPHTTERYMLTFFAFC